MFHTKSPFIYFCSLMTLLAPFQSLASDKPRTIITTDMETDDYNSMIRFLLYTNEIDVAGIVYSSSEYHWAGDGKGTLVKGPGGIPRASWRWTGTNRVQELLGDYQKALPNLRVHDRSYPAADFLMGLVKIGNIAFEGDMAANTEGSDLIKAELLNHKPGRLFLQAWGGTNTIARALKSIEETFRNTRRWDEVYAKVSRKAVIYTWGKQDKTIDNYIVRYWPDLQINDIGENAWGYGVNGPSKSNVLPEDSFYLEPEWTRSNVVKVGQLGAKYRVWGDGRTFAGDDADTFGFLPYPGRPLRQAFPPGSFVSEGDSPAFMNLIRNGLRAYENPGYGGWGNRLVRAVGLPGNQWKTAEAETGADGQIIKNYTSKRWVDAAQRDFAARLKWSTTSRFDEANHPPRLSVRPGREIRVKPGQKVKLSGRASDPDGNSVTYRWWHYPEAGSYPGRILVGDADYPTATFTVPADAKAGQTLHLILEVKDNGSPAITRYQRVIATVE